MFLAKQERRSLHVDKIMFVLDKSGIRSPGLVGPASIAEINPGFRMAEVRFDLGTSRFLKSLVHSRIRPMASDLRTFMKEVDKYIEAFQRTIKSFKEFSDKLKADDYLEEKELAWGHSLRVSIRCWGGPLEVRLL